VQRARQIEFDELSYDCPDLDPLDSEQGHKQRLPARERKIT
jgi:hypothetical protein